MDHPRLRGTVSPREEGNFWLIFNRPLPIIDPETLGFTYKEHVSKYEIDVGFTIIWDHKFAAVFSESTESPAYPELPAD